MSFLLGLKNNREEKRRQYFLEQCKDRGETEISVVARAGELMMTGMPYLGTSVVHLAYFSGTSLSPMVVVPQEVYNLFFVVPGRLEVPLDGFYMRVNPLLEMARIAQQAARESAQEYRDILDRSSSSRGLEFHVQPYISPSPIHPAMIPVGEGYQRSDITSRKVIRLDSRR
ncbi:hypothetical protein HYT52_01200 [Candidatus Woesearchaeota archaeon]|nr:hypothetical protein [Candidatus Woesearchaeota archaeon]